MKTKQEVIDNIILNSKNIRSAFRHYRRWTDETKQGYFEEIARMDSGNRDKMVHILETKSSKIKRDIVKLIFSKNVISKFIKKYKCNIVVGIDRYNKLYIKLKTDAGYITHFYEIIINSKRIIIDKEVVSADTKITYHKPSGAIDKYLWVKNDFKEFIDSSKNTTSMIEDSRNINWQKIIDDRFNKSTDIQALKDRYLWTRMNLLMIQ